MSNTLMNVIKFIVAAAMGCAVAYGWMVMRNEADMLLLFGIGTATTAITFVLLYMFGKSGGG